MKKKLYEKPELRAFEIKTEGAMLTASIANPSTFEEDWTVPESE